MSTGVFSLNASATPPTQGAIDQLVNGVDFNQLGNTGDNSVVVRGFSRMKSE